MGTSGPFIPAVMNIEERGGSGKTQLPDCSF
jgi:hypothetical protein